VPLARIKGGVNRSPKYHEKGTARKLQTAIVERDVKTPLQRYIQQVFLCVYLNRNRPTQRLIVPAVVPGGIAYTLEIRISGLRDSLSASNLF
jgi:hypothetical protein